MAASDRPTGLTALAVINFMWAAFHAFASIPMTAFLWYKVPRWIDGADRLSRFIQSIIEKNNLSPIAIITKQ